MEIFDSSLARLALSLGLGLLVGLERGWSQRARQEGTRVAGLRTFAIVGLSGGLCATIAQRSDILVLGFGFVAMAGAIVYAFWHGQEDDTHKGATTLFALFAVFALGALAVMGDWADATAAGIVLTLLLGLKPELHGWLRHLRRPELMAVLQLLLISAVLLPSLPDRGFGPWQALNPFRIWLMVVLIAGISFAGYVAVRLVGSRGGNILTGLVGGLASSTAVTVSLARMAHGHSPATPAARAQAAGAALACCVMFLRMLVVLAAINQALLKALAPPFLAAAAAGTVVALLLVPWRMHGKAASGGELPNPFALATALQFGAILAVVSLAAEGLRRWLGEAGLLVLAGISGLADVDAVLVSLAGNAGIDASTRIMVLALLLAAAANSAVKVAIGFVLGNRAFGLRLGASMAAALAAGAAVFLALGG